MDPSLMLDVLYGGVIVVFLLIIVLSRRARRHGGALQAGVVGAIYDLQNRDKQRALDVIVEGKAAATDPERAEGDQPQLEAPEVRIGSKRERDEG